MSKDNQPQAPQLIDATEDLGAGEQATQADLPSSGEGGLSAGRRIGAYSIVREIGRGGMGAVYLAVRSDAVFERQVAIKVTRGALASPDALARFKRERQILARLDHPNIARLLDGGATEDGLPYFVMEYIEGQPLHVFCDERRLGVMRRLELFLELCAAVAYAHRNLIVHRDIKPGNILVSATGVPRLLDFGIAKLLDPEAEPGAEPATAVVFTPWYASPEQIAGEPLTTATDIYSLGVLLYELLTGHRPYRMRGTQPLDLLRAIAEDEPERASAAIERSLELPTAEGVVRVSAESVSEVREGTTERLRQRLRGDLDAVLMLALRKEPPQRYATVEALMADVRAYLEGKPVSARQGDFSYRVGKFVRRHRWPMLVGATMLALVSGAGVNFVVQSRRVARERDRAERVSRFLVDLFSVSDPSEARGNSVTAREVLDKGAQKISSELKAQPEMRADLQETMADVYDRLGLYERSAELLREALSVRRAGAKREPAALAQSLNLLGNVLVDKGDVAGAEPAYRESLELRRGLFGPDSVQVAESFNNVASVLEAKGQYGEAEKMFAAALEVKRKLFGPENQRVATTLANIAVVRYKKGDLAGAESGFREALAMQRKLLGADHPEVAYTLGSLAVVLDEQGHHAQSEASYREALALQRKVLGAEHPDIATTLTNLANVLNHAGKLEAAALSYREALAQNRKFFGDDSNDVAAALVGLADVERQRGALEEALRLLRESARIREAKLGADHPDLADSLTPLGEILRLRGDLAEAEALQRRALAIREAALPPEHASRADSLVGLGRVLVDAKRFAEAEVPLLKAHELLQGQAGREARQREAVDALVSLYEGWGRSEQAARYRALRLREAAPPGKN